MLWQTPVISYEHFALRVRTALKYLKQLDVSKATGPDNLPARILYEIADVICEPLLALCKRMLQEGHWPMIWRFHNLVPLYRRKVVSDPTN